MLFHIKAYLKFLWLSKNEHAVHSPFVFSMMTKCWYDKKPKPDYLLLNNYRNTLLNNQKTIEVSDFGAGSRVFKSDRREISAIARNAGISKKRAELLFRITHYFKPDTILEIGTSLGLATSALALGNPRAKITTVEGCEKTIAVAQDQLSMFSFKNIEIVVSQFEDFFTNENLEFKKYQLIYFDGNHSKKATLNYFESLLPTVTNDSVWIFDDIHWSPKMEEAWEIIKKHPKVTVSIDTFQWGFIFFRSEQKKQDFILRT